MVLMSVVQTANEKSIQTFTISQPPQRLESRSCRATTFTAYHKPPRGFFVRSDADVLYLHLDSLITMHYSSLCSRTTFTISALSLFFPTNSGYHSGCCQHCTIWTYRLRVQIRYNVGQQQSLRFTYQLVFKCRHRSHWSASRYAHLLKELLRCGHPYR